MPTLAIINRDNGDYAIFRGGDISRVSPDEVMQRVEDAMGWLFSQPKPHTVVLDDPSGIAGALISAWVMTSRFACAVTFVTPEKSPVCQVGLYENGHAFITAYTTEQRDATQRPGPT